MVFGVTWPPADIDVADFPTPTYAAQRIDRDTELFGGGGLG